MGHSRVETSILHDGLSGTVIIFSYRIHCRPQGVTLYTSPNQQEERYSDAAPPEKNIAQEMLVDEGIC